MFASGCVDHRRRVFDRRAADRGRPAYRIRRCEDLRHDPCRHLELGDHRGLVQAVNLGSTAAPQLCDPEGGEDDELKRADAWRTLNHEESLKRRSPNVTSPTTTAMTNPTTRSLRCTALSWRRRRARQAAQRSSNAGSACRAIGIDNGSTGTSCTVGEGDNST